MKATGRKIERNGEALTLESEAWWLEVAVQDGDRIEVARIDATDGKELYMLSLTEQDLIDFQIEPCKYGTETPCPRPAQKVVTQQQHDHAMLMLQTEGYGYGDPIVDNTPYMKGDDLND